MDLRHDFNYNDPVEVMEIFRYRKNDDEALQEFGSKSMFGWEDVIFIKEYAFPDDWKKYNGPKYHVMLRGHNSEMLVLGDYESMARYWTQFRNKYPLFTEDENQG